MRAKAARAEVEAAVAEHRFGVREIAWRSAPHSDDGGGGGGEAPEIDVTTLEGASLRVALTADAFVVVAASGPEELAVQRWVGRGHDMLGTLLAEISPAYVRRFHERLVERLAAVAAEAEAEPDV